MNLYINKIILGCMLIFIVGCTVDSKSNLKAQSEYTEKQSLDIDLLELVASETNDLHQINEIFELLELNKNEIKKKDYHYIRSRLFLGMFNKEKGFKEMLLAFEHGHVEVGYSIYHSNLYNNSTINKTENLKYLKEAARRGDTSAMFIVGSSSLGGYPEGYLSQETGLKMLRQAAMNQNVQAIGRLGEHTLFAQGVISQSEHIFWESLNTLINKDEFLENIDNVLEEVDDKVQYCLLFKEFSEKNFEIIEDFAYQPDENYFLFWSKSFLFCNIQSEQRKE